MRGEFSGGQEVFAADGGLGEARYTGPLNVEREVEDQQERLRDIAGGLALLRRLTG